MKLQVTQGKYYFLMGFSGVGCFFRLTHANMTLKELNPKIFKEKRIQPFIGIEFNQLTYRNNMYWTFA